MTFPRAPDRLSGTLLAALPVVVLDTETTGLDTVKDRVIEIGAYRPTPGKSATEDDVFAALVDPGIAIPEASTRIHGITDKDTAGELGFGDAMRAFTDWAGPSIIVGYSIGFDIAILKAEHDRHGLPWRAPRSLDVRHLVQVLAPNLPNPSIETTAEWLGVDVTNRHRALGDAMVTARLFHALIPKLRDHGILTLAQAERACRSLGNRLDAEAQAGWLGPDPETDGRSRSIADFARIDSFPYRHTAGDLMRSPPIALPESADLTTALSLMVERGISSVILTPAGRHDTNGIVTERDVLKALHGSGPSLLDRQIGEIGTFPLAAIHQGEFVYRAMARMNAGGFRHLGVEASDGTLVGVLSVRDLLQQRADEAISLDDGIESADTPDDLAQVWSKLTAVAAALVYEDVDARSIATLISRELRALTQRACEIAEAELRKSGHGGPPVPYAMMVLGSGGRGESLLAMDQDNAVVYADDPNDRPHDEWFESLGKRVADILNDVGVVYCKGGVMAMNAAWRKDVAGWRATIGSWIGKSRPEDLLNCDIFFDALPVHGNSALSEAVRKDALSAARSARPFQRFLALNAGRFNSQIGWFGRLKTEDGRIDLKLNGILPIISTARVVALQHGLDLRGTPERLSAARDLGLAKDRTIDNLIEAHGILLNRILRQQLRDLDQGVALSNRVTPGDLSGIERQELKWALEQVPRVADLLGTPVVG
ncbi:CBS domain-containing protein [Rhodospirillaceae bacterium KN72]|uniref:CBS domain-containing protein n=1 Tax=Pacificispira spongiicola TaxID=2729598 RepID=A0A7Y0HIL6_9PROT|nr:DUF294 nucleotidyltransferase-like domain-containing protein [Pacificispira spongiicola]NMM46689.1 CBS domain-containing protein [Pacificispira spongiicola]